MYGEINTHDLQKKLKESPNSVVIDVRTLGEVRSGVVPGAVHIDLFGAGFLEKIKVLDKSLTYYIICLSGNRSDSVAGAMSHMGFEHVFNVTGGMVRWNGDLEYPGSEQSYRSA